MATSTFVIWDRELNTELEYDDFKHAESEYKHKLAHQGLTNTLISDRFKLYVYVKQGGNVIPNYSNTRYGDKED